MDNGAIRVLDYWKPTSKNVVSWQGVFILGYPYTSIEEYPLGINKIRFSAFDLKFPASN